MPESVCQRAGAQLQNRPELSRQSLRRCYATLGLGQAGTCWEGVTEKLKMQSWVSGVMKAREPGAAAALPHPLPRLPSPTPAPPPPPPPTPPFLRRDKPKLQAEPLRSASWWSSQNPQLQATCWTSALPQAPGKNPCTHTHTDTRCLSSESERPLNAYILIYSLTRNIAFDPANTS